MEQIVNLHIEKLPEGVFLATSDEVPGLVAQGRTLAETIEIARDLAKNLQEATIHTATLFDDGGQQECDLPEPFAGKFPITDEAIDQAKREGRE